MSAFREYAEKADMIARKAFEEYSTAVEAYKLAKENLENAPLGDSWRDREKFARLQVHFEDAKNIMEQAKARFEHHNEDFEQIRTELAAAIERHFTVNPGDVDASTLALLNSGILKTADFEKLMENAERAENLTMIRLIADKASDVEKRISYGGNDMIPDAIRLRAIISKSKGYDGREYLDGFDTIAEIFERSTKNPEMIRYWDELAGPVIEDF